MAAQPAGDDGEDLAQQWELLGANPELASIANGSSDQQDEGDVYELWPEHQQAWECFLACSGSQWRVLMGMGAALYQGLDYGSLETVIRIHQIPRNQQRQVFDQVRILEDEALKHLNTK